MRLGLRVLVILALVFVTTGAENKGSPPLVAALEKAMEFDLYSLDPTAKGEKDGFHGYKVLGKVAIKDDATRKALAAAFKKAVEEKGLSPARCFIPRHGIRVKHEGKTIDLVICFECAQVADYTDDQAGKGCLIGTSAQAAFNKVLQDGGVPLPKQPEK